ncbi:MAG: DEAD/DEAH box helicase [Acidimicrobiales bacterium]
MSTGFDSLHPIVQHHIVNSLGWRELRPLQDEAVAPILDGEHVLALAPTAGGKTEAAVFPILSQILSDPRPGLSTLYLCPLRALLNNLHVRLEQYASFAGLRAGVWHGDIGSAPRRRIIEDPPEILLTTPESLEAMLLSVKTDHRNLFRNVRTVVIDEVHAFGGDDRGWHLLGVLERLTSVAGRDLQRIGLSATVGDPDRLLEWLVGSSTGERRVVAPDAGGSANPPEITIDQVGSTTNAAIVISRLHAGEKRLVFVDSRSGVEALAAELRSHDVTTFVSHASLAVDERRRAEQAFAEARDCVIVSTSTLELGIDVGDLDRVIQIDSPTTVASFLQRLGRSGRRSGTARNMLFLTTGDGLPLLQTAGLMQLWSTGYVEPVEAPPLPLHLLAHQLLAYVIQEGQVGRNLWPEVVGRLPAYADAIASGDAAQILEHLLGTGMLIEDGGMLSIGPEGERSYGFRHFIALTSAFTSPQTFVVRHGANELGYLDPTSLLTNDRGYATVLLAGRSWKITSIDWNRRFAWVEPSEQSGRSRWFGAGRAINAELCDAMRDVASGTDPAGVTLTERARAALADVRGELSFAQPGRTAVVVEPTKARWWTWAGQRANASLSDALGDLASSRGDDLSIGLDPTRASSAKVKDQLSDLHPETLPTPSIAAPFAENMKFSDCLPPALALEVARQRLVDPAGVRRVLDELWTDGGDA